MKKILKLGKAIVLGWLVVLLVISGTVFAANFFGGSFPIRADNTIDEVSASIAYNSEREEYFVVWSNGMPGCDDIQGQRLTKRGVKIGDAKYISNGCPNARWMPDVAYDSQHDQYLVVWHDYDNTETTSSATTTRARRVSGAGVVLDTSDIIIRDPGDKTKSAGEPAVAYSIFSDRYLVVYSEYWYLSTKYIGGQVVTDTGSLEGSQIIIASSTNTLYDPDVAYNFHNDRYLVVWEEELSGGDDYDIFGQQVQGNGNLWGSVSNIAITGYRERYPKVAALPFAPTDAKFLVVFQYEDASYDDEIYGMRVQEDGAALFPIIHVADTSIDEIRPAIAGSEGNLQYFVTWETYSGGTSDPIQGQSISYDGTLTESLAQAMLRGDLAMYPAVAAGPVGDFLVAWHERQGTDFNIYGSLVGNRNYIPLVRH
jgi:hypothetical protein